MKLLKKAWLGLALAAGVLASGSASAVVICNGCAQSTGVASFLGNLNPTTADQSAFTHTGIPSTAPFTDWWIFGVSPAGQAGINAIFLPTDAVSGFTVELYALSSQTCNPLVGSPATTAASCSAFTTAGAAIATNVGAGATNFLVNIAPLALSGNYAFKITGLSIATGFSNLYSGNVTTTNIPEPGSLALAGLGLLAAGAFMRRRA